MYKHAPCIKVCFSRALRFVNSGSKMQESVNVDKTDAYGWFIQFYFLNFLLFGVSKTCLAYIFTFFTASEWLNTTILCSVPEPDLVFRGMLPFGFHVSLGIWMCEVHVLPVGWWTMLCMYSCIHPLKNKSGSVERRIRHCSFFFFFKDISFKQGAKIGISFTISVLILHQVFWKHKFHD